MNLQENKILIETFLTHCLFCYILIHSSVVSENKFFSDFLLFTLYSLLLAPFLLLNLFYYTLVDNGFLLDCSIFLFHMFYLFLPGTLFVFLMICVFVKHVVTCLWKVLYKSQSYHYYYCSGQVCSYFKWTLKIYWHDFSLV